MWQKIDDFNDILELSGVKLYLSGVALQKQQGPIITGSACSLLTSPRLRAEFEALERITMLEANQLNPFFPNENTNNGDYQYSLSSGLALATDEKTAQKKARAELIERDLVLRSWFGEFAPIPIEIPPQFRLQFHATLSCYDFSYSAKQDEVKVYGFFAETPTLFVYGLGSHENKEIALEHAFLEMLQRLGFLYDSEADSKSVEEFNNQLPEEAPTALYHQEYFLRTQGITQIKNWLGGKHLAYQGILPARPAAPQVSYSLINKGLPLDYEHIGREADFKAPIRNDSIFVVRASSPDLAPLIFGRNYTLLGKAIPSHLQIHPIV